MIKKSTAITFDDINLVPSYSEIESRSDKDISLKTQLSRNYSLQIPLIASPMDTVCDSEMAIAMSRLGGVGCVHRFMDIDVQAKEIETTRLSVSGEGFGGIYEAWDLDLKVPVMAAIGANGDYLERAQELVANGANILLIDVAHGHHKFVKIALEQLKKELPSFVDIIAGNVATYFGAMDLIKWGADGVRVGIGNGALCTTRIKTGFGVPSITAIEAAAKARNDYSAGMDDSVPIIADGGIRDSGDIAKALAVGANTVILGSLLAGTKEAPGAIIEKPTGLYKRYRGSASLETKNAHGQKERNVEGESTIVPFKGGVKFVVDNLLDGVRSALSYNGSSSLEKFNPEYVIVTPAGTVEARPHLL